MFFKIIKRDLLIAYRQRTQTLQPLVFYMLIGLLFPLAFQANLIILKNVAVGIIWVANLLTILLFLDNLYRSDFDEGSLEQLLLNPYPFALSIYAKIIANLIIVIVPLVFLTPFLGLILHIPMHGLLLLIISLLLGTPSLILIGAIASALTLSLPRAGLLLPLILLPLYVPVLIFGASAGFNAVWMLPVSNQLILLTAFLILTLVLAPIAIAAALKLSLNNA